ncbi:MAG: hypothetical protein ABEK50_02290 [bacterium]
MDVLDYLPDSSPKQVLAVGTFDGIHRGHQAILQGALDRARDEDLPASVVTFEPDPVTVLKGTPPTERRLLTFEDKRAILNHLGFDRMYALPFDEDFASTSAQSFVESILVERLNAASVHVGYNFRFGRNREGDTEFLRKGLNNHGIDAVIQDPIVAGGDPVSSTRIRSLLKDGSPAEARRLLGRP